MTTTTNMDCMKVAKCFRTDKTTTRAPTSTPTFKRQFITVFDEHSMAACNTLHQKNTLLPICKQEMASNCTYSGCGKVSVQHDERSDSISEQTTHSIIGNRQSFIYTSG